MNDVALGLIDETHTSETALHAGELYVAQTETATMMVATLTLKLKALSQSVEHPILAALDCVSTGLHSLSLPISIVRAMRCCCY